MKNIFLKSLILLLFPLNLFSQQSDSATISEIYKNALSDYSAYNNLKLLCDSASPRPLGSEKSIKALHLLKNMLESIGVDNVELQSYETDIWKNISASAKIISTNNDELNLNVVAQGPSIATKSSGITAKILKVNNLGDLEKLPNEKVEGKIVFFNSYMKNTFINPIDAYVDAVGPRFYGATKAAEMGAVGIIVRSVTSAMDSVPRSGCLRYNNKIDRIPSVIVSPFDAELLCNEIEKDQNLLLNITVQSEVLNSKTTYNLIADIKGKANPDEIILIGGHVDTWFNTPGAHDDGAGCVQMVDVLRLFNELKINNNRTVRCVLFMDEEMFQSGAKAFSEKFDANNEKIIAAIESDLGGYQPNGFFIDADGKKLEFIKGFKKWLKPYGLYKFEKGFGGGDMSVIKRKYDFISIALRVENQEYFDIMHTPFDTFDKVNRRELQFGSAAITSLVFLIDKYVQE